MFIQIPDINSVNLPSKNRALSGIIFVLAFACGTSHDQLDFHLVYYLLIDIHLKQENQCLIYKYSKTCKIPEIKQSIYSLLQILFFYSLETAIISHSSRN